MSVIERMIFYKSYIVSKMAVRHKCQQIMPTKEKQTLALFKAVPGVSENNGPGSQPVVNKKTIPFWCHSGSMHFWHITVSKCLGTTQSETYTGEADISEGSLDYSSDKILKALETSNRIGEQLYQILVRLDWKEMKMKKLEGVLDKISNLKEAINTNQRSVIL